MRFIRVAPLYLLTAACSILSPEYDAAVALPAEPASAKSRDLDDQAHYGTRIAIPPLEEAKLLGKFEQGGWIRGVAPPNAVHVTVDGERLLLDEDRTFFVGLDRDAAERIELVVHGIGDRTRTETVTVSPRAWKIEHVNVARRPGGGNDEEWWKQREPEFLAIRDARAKTTGAQGWRQDFIWPVTGRISGRFGRQRIYRGEPGSYHSGLDIAPGHGASFVAPADGVVVLARTGFSLEGGIVIVDHGAGLNSAFIHLSRIAVKEGEAVRQGQELGNVGASGRATGPHLHWSLMWRDKRLDPLLFLPPMP